MQVAGLVARSDANLCHLVIGFSTSPAIDHNSLRRTSLRNEETRSGSDQLVVFPLVHKSYFGRKLTGLGYEHVTAEGDSHTFARVKHDTKAGLAHCDRVVLIVVELASSSKCLGHWLKGPWLPPLRPPTICELIIAANQV